MKTILEIKNLNVYFQGLEQKHHAVRGVNLTLEKGETLALVGESGSGKSVTAMSIMRLLPKKTTIYSEGSEVIFEGQNLLSASEEHLIAVRGNRIGMIFQEPMTSLNPFMKIGEQLTEALLAHQPKLSPDVANTKAEALLSQVGISEARRRMKQYPHEFSGGQLQRIMIAMALINEPDVLIADEPTTALDVTVQAEVLDLLHELQKDFGMAIIFITHDLALAQHYSDRVCVMKLGEIVETGDIQQVFEAPQHPYTVELIHATPSGLKEPYSSDASVLLTAENINVEFITERSFWGKPLKRFQAVKNGQLTLHKGQTIGIVGESGSGKSTFGKALLGMVDYSGQVKFENRPMDTFLPYEHQALKAHMQIVFQDPFGSLSPRLTVGEIIGEGLLVHQPQLSKNQRLEKVAKMLEEVALSPDMMNRYPHEFSGGQRQRIAIARAVILEPKFVLLDEPTSALDRSIQVKVVELLRDLQKKYGLSYVFISHDLAVVRAMSDDVMVMKQGEMVEYGSAEDIFYRPQTEYTQRLLKSAFDL